MIIEGKLNLYKACVVFLRAAVERQDAPDVKFWIKMCHDNYEALDKPPDKTYLDNELKQQALEIIVKDMRK